MEDLLAKSLKKTEDMIKNIIEIELGHINTDHPDFIDVISLVKTSSDNKSKESTKMKIAESEISLNPKARNPHKICWKAPRVFLSLIARKTILKTKSMTSPKF